MAEIPIPTTSFIEDDEKKRRPLGVTVLALLLVLGAVLNLLGSSVNLMIYGPIYGSYYIFTGLANLIIGIALFQLLPWSRMAAIIMQILGLVAGFVLAFWIGGILDAIIPGASMLMYMSLLPSVIISLIVIIYLLQGSVKAAFESGDW